MYRSIEDITDVVRGEVLLIGQFDRAVLAAGKIVWSDQCYFVRRDFLRSILGNSQVSAKLCMYRLDNFVVILTDVDKC